MENKRNSLYVVLVRANTGLGKITRTLFGYEYTHIAVCFDRKLEDFVTFSRRRHFAPFDAGFMHEKRGHYAFGNRKTVKVKVFRVPVTADKMQEILHFVETVEQDKEYVFNLYSMLTMPFLHGFLIYKAHNCMSFVGKILELTGEITLQRPYYRYNIQEIEGLLTKYFYKEGRLKKRAKEQAYMKPVGLIENGKAFLRLNNILIRRLLHR